MSSDPQNNQSDRQCSLTLMIQIWISSTSVHIARGCESLEIRAQLSVNDACECFTVWWTLTASCASCSSSRCATTSVFLFDPPGLENWKAGEAISLLILQLKACEGGPLVADSRGEIDMLRIKAASRQHTSIGLTLTCWLFLIKSRPLLSRVCHTPMKSDWGVMEKPKLLFSLYTAVVARN